MFYLSLEGEGTYIIDHKYASEHYSLSETQCQKACKPCYDYQNFAPFQNGNSLIKGQTISKANYGVLYSPKNEQKFTILSIFNREDAQDFFCSFFGIFFFKV